MIDKFQDIDYSIDRQDGDLTPIQMFYRNTKIFITGSTGFLGIILIEKLLRSCPDCSLYLLIRPKKGKTMETRFDELFEQDVFQRMKNHCPKFRERLVGIEGDLTKPNLGLSPENIKLLTKEIHIVFHVAATVRFDEKLKTAVPINICATQDLIRLARQMPKLKSLVHVSTAYCNCIHDVMEEKIYPSTVDYKLLISMTENLPDNILENITPGEPIRGWINNIYGPTGVVTGAGVGLLRVLHCNGQVNANLVPVDMCVNGLIIVACEVGKAFENTRNDPYFATKQWTLKSGNLKKLITTMSDRDRKIFFCDLKQINWDEYFQTYTLGGRIYLIKDDMNTLSEAKKKWDR
ncbi:hypothetical protein NQ314_005906 [Rhamnusium bicolor]|uniref:Fatty acyl-CoA reductase n=1 Tax=Rhamnusium bicolor TaxID=1586634 RepID=A0AAV8ZE13_9CUCU|nr:hypothetical protein NQ314_005906 [Rhamnusium bicolor]